MATISHADLEALWTFAGGSQATADTAAAIAQAESGGDPSAILNTAYPNLPGYQPPAKGNLPEYSVGLWQINVLAHPQYTAAQMLNPRLNANAAVAISNGGASFSAWSTYKSGAYKSYLTSAGTPTAQAGIVTGGSPFAAATVPGGFARFSHALAHDLPTGMKRAHVVRRAAVAKIMRRSRIGIHGR